MREDQKIMLAELSEKLADVFLQEADPVNWSGAGKLPVDLTREERGDRKWDKQNAMATGGVLRYVMDVTKAAQDRAIDDDAEQAERDSDLDRQIREAEKRATSAMNRVLSKAKTGAE